MSHALSDWLQETVCPAASGNASICGAEGAYAIQNSLLGVLNKVALDPVYFCTNMVYLCPHSAFDYYHAEAYANQVVESKPEFLKENNYLDSVYAKMKSTMDQRETLRVAHISDAHID